MFLDSGLYLNMRIALDVMGGDNAHQAIMAGAVEALEAFGGDLQKLFLVGDETAIKEELKHLSYAHGKIEIVHASEVVTMRDSAEATSAHPNAHRANTIPASRPSVTGPSTPCRATPQQPAR